MGTTSTNRPPRARASRSPTALWIGLFLLWAPAAIAKPWNGVEAGVSRRDEVIQKFGEPSKVLQTDGKEVLAYLGKDAIKGTSQTQFRIDPKTHLVERIDVFPGPVIERETVESTYGPACPGGASTASTCYVKKLTDDFRTYFFYAKLGMAIFFNEDGKTVQSFVFQPAKAGKP